MLRCVAPVPASERMMIAAAAQAFGACPRPSARPRKARFSMRHPEKSHLRGTRFRCPAPACARSCPSAPESPGNTRSSATTPRTWISLTSAKAQLALASMSGFPAWCMPSLHAAPHSAELRPAFDASKALATPGVLQVFEIPARGFRVFTAGGIVVVASSTWAAMQGRKALNIKWNLGPHANESTESLRRQMQLSLAGSARMVLRAPRTRSRHHPCSKAHRDRLRISLPLPCLHGADEHHHASAGRQM